MGVFRRVAPHVGTAGRFGRSHNESGPEPCVDCGRMTCVRYFDGNSWIVVCAEHLTGRRLRAGADTLTALEGSIEEARMEHPEHGEELGEEEVTLGDKLDERDRTGELPEGEEPEPEG